MSIPAEIPAEVKMELSIVNRRSSRMYICKHWGRLVGGNQNYANV